MDRREHLSSLNCLLNPLSSKEHLKFQALQSILPGRAANDCGVDCQLKILLIRGHFPSRPSGMQADLWPMTMFTSELDQPDGGNTESRDKPLSTLFPFPGRHLKSLYCRPPRAHYNSSTGLSHGQIVEDVDVVITFSVSRAVCRMLQTYSYSHHPTSTLALQDCLERQRAGCPSIRQPPLTLLSW